MGARGPKSRVEKAREVREATGGTAGPPAYPGLTQLDHTLSVVLSAVCEAMKEGRVLPRDMPPIMSALVESRILLTDPGLAEELATQRR